MAVPKMEGLVIVPGAEERVTPDPGRNYFVIPIVVAERMEEVKRLTSCTDTKRAIVGLKARGVSSVIPTIMEPATS